MFNKEELQIIAQSLSQAQTTVGNSKPAFELLEKVIKELEALDKDDK